MFQVISCLTGQHDLRLVVLAALVCAIGSWITFRLYERGASDVGIVNLGWQFLAASAAGSSIWSTHFIAMLAYRTEAPVYFDAVPTIISILIAICGCFAGFAVAGSKIPRSYVAGGILIGLSASSMHYVGMQGFHIDGLISWNDNYIAASIAIAICASVAALWMARRENPKTQSVKSAGLFVAGIIGLHFVGMTALRVTPLVLRDAPLVPQDYIVMALAIALAGFVIISTGLTSFIIDSRVRSASDHKLNQLALYDSLTGLPNRQNFRNMLFEEFSRCESDGKSFAYIIINLNRFKEINDTRGHLAGDTVLSVIGNRLKEQSVSNFYFARTGGDEFVAICKSSSEKQVLELMLHLRSVLAETITLNDGTEASVSASLGAAFFPADASDLQDLVNKADLALYRAKSQANRTICFYDAAMDEAMRQRKALAADLQNAISNDELELYYQVQTSVAKEHITGFEVLLRWRHPERGSISPSEFIPVAEDSGLIREIGRWVLETACHQAAEWNNHFKIAVNLSPIQLSDPDLPDLVRLTLEKTGLPADRLELELTESMIVENHENAFQMINRIRSLGVTIALDDFGTGYSSLETLRSFPFDKIKLDRSFVTEIEDSQQARAIVRAVLALGKSLEIPVLAEGVETQVQLDILNAEGCDAVQGYLLGPPLPLDEILSRFDSLEEIADENVKKLRAISDPDVTTRQETASIDNASTDILPRWQWRRVSSQ
jgi:diguanylate cyclase